MGELEKILADKSALVEKLKNAQKAKIAALKEVYEDQITALKDAHEDEMTALKIAHETQIFKLLKEKSSDEAQMASLKNASKLNFNLARSNEIQIHELRQQNAKLESRNIKLSRERDSMMMFINYGIKMDNLILKFENDF